jgi:hypothetical protein
MVVYNCNTSCPGGIGRSETLSKKQLNYKRTGDMFQVVDFLPNKHEVLSSNTSTAKKKRKRTFPHHVIVKMKMLRLQNKEAILKYVRGVLSYLQRQTYQNNSRPLSRSPKGQGSMH